MNRLIFRFYTIKDNSFFEVSFDSRLSFKDNFKLLNDIYPISISDVHIYDESSKEFLDLDIPLIKYGFSYYNKLYIFN